MHRLLSAIILSAFVVLADAKDFTPTDARSIRAAMQAAQAGDTISIPPGEYDMVDTIATGNSGTPAAPITMRTSGDKGYAKLKISAGSDVGFRIISRFWVLRGLHLEGNLTKTEDLIQIDATRGGGDFQMTDCRVSRCREFLFKASRNRDQGADHVLLDHCEWFDTAATAIDIVGGDHWIIRGNYVHDYGKDGGVHYGMFLKGGGKNGLMEGNIVDGKAGKVTVGISFGGGLTDHRWLPQLEGGQFVPEHLGGICRNNIVIRTGDCAYHTNNASGCRFYNNLAYECGAGFQRQASYPPDPVLVNNVLSGSIRGAGDSRNNLTKVESTWFMGADNNDFRLTPAGKAALAGKGEALKDNPLDFFSQPRNTNDLGPVNASAGASTRWVDRRMP